MRRSQGFTPLEMVGRRLKQNEFSTINQATQDKSLCYGRSPKGGLPARRPASPAVSAKRQAGGFAPAGGSLTGFTFIELLIVSALSALVLLTIYSGFRNGMLIWRRAQQRNIKQEKIILFMERFDRELNNTFIFSGIGFEGKESEVSFPALLLTQVKLSQGEEETENVAFTKTIGRIIYRWDKEHKIIKRLQQNYSEIYQDKKDVPSRNLVIGIEDLIFKYYRYDVEQEEFTWLEDWSEPDQLPMAIKVEIKVKDMNEKEKTITRTISIPSG